MERRVAVYANHKVATLFFQPYGSYRGYGALMGRKLMRTLPDDSAPRLVGELVVAMLQESKKTGFDISERDTLEVQDAISQEITKRFNFQTLKLIQCDIVQNDGQRSWKVVPLEPPRRQKAYELPPVYVRVSAGPEALGAAVLDALRTSGAATQRSRR